MEYGKKIIDKFLTKSGFASNELPTDLEKWNEFLALMTQVIQENNDRKKAQELTLEVGQKEMERINLQLKKFTDEEIERQKANYETLAMAIESASLVAITDGDGVMTEVNDTFCQISGFDRKELIGQTHKIVNSGYHPKEFFGDMWKTLIEGSIWRGEICNRRKDGKYFWVDTTIVPVLDKNGKPVQFIAIRFDITSRKNTESSLMSASKMASLGEMAAGMAHEINNPLTIITGTASRLEMLIVKKKFDETLFLKDVKMIGTTAMRISKIVKGLKTISRSGEDDSFENVALEKIVNETVDLSIERFKTGGVDLRVSQIPNIEIQCRAVQVSQVLLNLLNNSFDVLEGKVDSWVAVECLIEQNDHEGNPTMVKIQVTDSGLGIPPHVVEKLMQPFFTTKGVGKGTGLGLSISKGIIEKHNGKFWLDQNCPNTRFIIELPLKQK
jgi:PAS domain S-box-containing protein